ncbi:MFS transporter [Glycomyces sp. NPDC047010]|uniref:MFS transporter n=1 Tax=Glycomyces sp. NPDC047010 TaxID=3155023 RepID=UPI0033D38685
MISGFLISFTGSMFAESALPALIAVGVLPVVSLTLFRTAGMVLDMGTPLAMRFLARFSPGRLLQTCELIDIALCLTALALITALDVPIAAVIIVYLLATTILPLVVDVAEELYIAQVSMASEDAAVRYNAAISSSTALLGFVIAQPLGAFIAEQSVVLLLIANTALSAVALTARTISNRMLPTTPFEQTESGRDRNRQRISLRQKAVFAFSLGTISPIISGSLALANGIIGGYVVIWAASSGSNLLAQTGIGLLCVGLGAAIGPLTARHAIRRIEYSTAMITAAAILLASLTIALIAATALPSHSTATTSLTWLALLGAAFARSAAMVLYASARQARLKGPTLLSAIGTSRSFSAAGTLTGVWLGLTLAVADHPALGLTLAALVIAAMLLFMTLRKGDTPIPSTQPLSP